GVDLISLGIGDPDISTPDFIIEKIIEEIRKPNNHNYPSSMGELDFRQAVAQWYKNRFEIDLNPNTEISHVIGGKEGVSNVSRAFINPGDYVLSTSPGYPVYQNGAATLNNANAFVLPLTEENDFLPDYGIIPKEVLEKSKILYINYPNNPTGAIATDKFYDLTISFAKKNNLIIISDNPYSEFTFGDYIAPSILQYNGAMECAVEINSMSKMFCMTGHRIGWVAGNKDVIFGLRKIKSNIDSGGPTYIQRGVIPALELYTSPKKPEIVLKNMVEYEKRMKYLVDRLNKMGWPSKMPKATFYLWQKLPEGETNSMEFTKKLIEAGVVITPGTGFGKEGEGFVRFALTVNMERLEEACNRIEKVISGNSN
ncbi:MAG: aminotransferase class I/II-fold pyridoxal phosphate-dependent enzyme, partial [archaeon]|nr:aminotransferase class I/II-fold pyridoxal phosphate-dependent enzyme [archaeon]